MMLRRLSNVKSIFFVLMALSLLGISFSGYTADPEIPTQKITINGTVNINKNPDDNGYIPPLRYVFVSEPYTGPLDVMIMSLPKVSYVAPYMGVDLGHGIYAVIGIRDNGGDHWDISDGDLKVSPGGSLLISIVTASEGTDFTGSLSSGNIPLGIITHGDCNGVYSNDVCAEYNLNINLNVSNSSCLITTPHDAVFNWPGISPSEIRNGSVAVQTAPVTMSCTSSAKEGVVARPVAITFTSSNGSQDAANGIIKTDKENLGLQLTWHSNGQPIAQDKVIEFPAIASATEDFSVDAKPVLINGTQQITGGSFATTVTMSVEYR